MASPDAVLQAAILQQSIADQQAHEAQAPAAPAAATPRTPEMAVPTFTPGPTGQDLTVRDQRQHPADPSQMAEPGLADPTAQAAEGVNNLVDAAGGGIMQGMVWQPHDFLFGPTPEDQKSAFRKADEASTQAAVGQTGLAGGLTEGVGQFVGGLVGLGKLTEGLKVLPWIGRGIEAAGEFLPSLVTNTGKASLVNAVSFDPHQQRLSNLLIQYPWLTNSVTSYLAAKPGDSDAEGRVKNVLENLGIEAVGAGLVLGGVKLYKVLATGDKGGIAAATAEVQAAQGAVEAPQAAAPSAPPSGGFVTLDEGKAQGLDKFGAPDTNGIRQRKGLAAVQLDGQVFTAEDHVQAVDKAAAALGPGTEARIDAAPQQHLGFVPREAPKEAAAKPRVSVSWDANGQPVFTPKQFLDSAEGKSGTGDLTATPAAPDNAAATGGPQDAQAVGMGGAGAPASVGGVNPPDAGARTTGGVDVGANPSGGVGLDGLALPVVGARTGGVGPAGGVVEAAARPADATLTAVPNATEGLAQEGLAGTKRPPQGPKFPQDMVDGILAAAQKDWDALDERGWDWASAVMDGYKFATNPNTMPYNKMAGPTDVEALIGQVTTAAKGWLDKAKGGDILSDARVQKRVGQWEQAFNLDPSTVMGELAKAGKAANEMVAQMEAGYLVANRAYQDATATATRITSGILDSASGAKNAANELLQQQLAVATQALGYANSIRSAGGRVVRRNRAEFMPKAADIAALRSADPDLLAQLVKNAGGDIRNLRAIARPSVWSKLTDAANFLYVNNLLWGWKTHVVNAVSNTYMMFARPAERIIGSYTVGNMGASIRDQSLKQYYYMAASANDSFKAATQAFLVGDSKIAPHNTELYRTGTGGALPGAKAPLPDWKPETSMENVGYNALVSGAKIALGMPTRVLGASDEMMKQVTYRSVVASRAAMQATQEVRAMGMAGPDAAKYINKKVSDAVSGAFDDNGYATDMGAKHEAQIATFSEDLNPGTLGKIAQSAIHNIPVLRLILPFVKTPTNVLRYGIRMTPVLNLAVTDFRRAFFGKLGDTPLAQATNMAQARGQMALGMSFLTAAYFAKQNGLITGGGPADPKARKDLIATGWQPYAMVTTNPDGTKTYNGFLGRSDPVAMPFGIVADIMDIMERPEGSGGAEAAAASLLMALTKQITQKTYLTSLSQFLDTVNDPQPNKVGRFTGQLASNMIPPSSLLRETNGWFGDDLMRESRGFVDQIMSTIPGLSAQLPAKRDPWGDPVHVRQGFSTTDHGFVDQELERLTMDTADGKSIASTTPTHNEADLRQVTMKDGRNAYDRLQELSGHLPSGPALKALVAKVMDTPAYRNAPDGSATLKGTKLYMLGSVINPYHEKAFKVLQADPEVRKALYAANEKVRAAYATQQRDPQGALPQAKTLNGILQGVGLPAIQPLVAPARPTP